VKSNEDSTAILESMTRLERWIEGHDYKGYEPFDGNSSFLRVLTFENLFLQRLLQQLVRQSPINLRPILGVPRLDSTKGRGYIGWGYLDRFRTTGEERYKEKAMAMLEWLDENKSPLYEHHSWGNHFHYASRAGTIPKHASTIVWTSLIGFFFLDAYERFAVPRHLDVIKSIANWIVALPREVTEHGTCLSYVMYGQSSIHNSNMLGSAFLARAARVTGNDEWRDLAREAMRYSCNGQLENGAWFYGEDEKYHWIDSFHTGYNLDALKRFVAATGEREFGDHLSAGYSFFKEHFVDPDGCPRYYWDRTQPVDIQCAAQIIDTFVHWADSDPDALDLATSVARWTIRHMQGRDGHFFYRKYPLGINARAPMIHWGQATMYKALCNLLLSRTRRNDEAGAGPHDNREHENARNPR